MSWDGKLGNTSFNVKYLQSVTVDEAVETMVNPYLDKNRIVNAWKKANPNKAVKSKKKE